MQCLLRVGALELANVQLESKESFKLDGMTKERAYFHVQQTALVRFFPTNLVPRRGFELTSVELHRDPGPFGGRSTN